MNDLLSLVSFVDSIKDEAILFAVAGVILGFLLILKAVSFVIQFVKRA